MKRIWKPLVATLLFVAVAAGAGVASAYWGSTGTGSGVATTGDMDPVTIESATAGDVNGSLLLPGGQSDVVLKVHNPNAFPVQVVNILQIEDSEISGHDGIGSCDTTGVTYTAPVSGRQFGTMSRIRIVFCRYSDVPWYCTEPRTTKSSPLKKYRRVGAWTAKVKATAANRPQCRSANRQRSPRAMDKARRGRRSTRPSARSVIGYFKLFSCQS